VPGVTSAYSIHSFVRTYSTSHTTVIYTQIHRTNNQVTYPSWSQHAAKPHKHTSKTTPPQATLPNPNPQLKPPHRKQIPQRSAIPQPRTTQHQRRTKTTKPDSAATTEDTKIVIINRAPVLHLWSACVAHFLYPELSWETCLSAGSAVSAICAVAKGRSIGTVPEKDDAE
jgi:hypothetical protein